MPFDPTKPAPGDDLDAVLVRDQLNALKALIDALETGKASAADLQTLALNFGNFINQVNTEFATTSSNSNGVSLMNSTVSDPPNQAQVQAISAKLDELIAALRR